jgi:hypothetical protein
MARRSDSGRLSGGRRLCVDIGTVGWRFVSRLGGIVYTYVSKLTF